MTMRYATPTVFISDQQLYKIDVDIKWAYQGRYDKVIPGYALSLVIC